MNYKEKAKELITGHGYETAMKIVDLMIKRYGQLKETKSAKKGLLFWENVKTEIEKEIELKLFEDCEKFIYP